MSAKDNLAVWKQVGSVAVYNESFMKLLIDIPTICVEEEIDRYIRGLKPYISTEMCIRNYQSLNTPMSDALSVEEAKKSFTPNNDFSIPEDKVTPMNVSNTRLHFKKRRQNYIYNGACFYCQEKGYLMSSCC